MMLIKPDAYGLHPRVRWSVVKHFEFDTEAIERLVKLECSKHLDLPLENIKHVDLLWDNGNISVNITTDIHEKDIGGTL